MFIFLICCLSISQFKFFKSFSDIIYQFFYFPTSLYFFKGWKKKKKKTCGVVGKLSLKFYIRVLSSVCWRNIIYKCLSSFTRIFRVSVHVNFFGHDHSMKDEIFLLNACNIYIYIYIYIYKFISSKRDQDFFFPS